MRLFTEAGLPPTPVQLADSKQTIVNLVAAGLGVAIVPRWTSKLAIEDVAYVPLSAPGSQVLKTLPLAAAWVGGSRDPVRDRMVSMLREKTSIYARDG
jgi:DNA-binding transcriptional LysR family regulator